MNLQFDSIDELEQFLMFSAHIGKAFTPAPSTDYPADLKTEPVTLAEETEPAATTQGEDGPLLADGGTSAEPPKRKRRTKAELQAAADETARADGDNLAAQLPPANDDEAKAQIDAIPGTDNPFAQPSPTTQTILEAPNQSAATLAGMAAMQRPLDAEPVAAPRAIESIDHLRACQSFIQKHGMAKYNESFRDGLNANIAIYTPEQRAQHVGILEALGA